MANTAFSTAIGGNTAAASQAEMETATSTSVFSTPGLQQNHPGHPKAWCHFNGTGTIAIVASYNTSSLNDNGAGNYDVVWDTDFSSANYAVTGNAQGASGNADLEVSVGLEVLATTDAQILVANLGDGTQASAFVDSAIICVSAFGDQ